MLQSHLSHKVRHIISKLNGHQHISHILHRYIYISLDDTPLNIKIATWCNCNMPVYFHYSSQVSCSACNDQSDITSQVFLLIFSLSFDIPMEHNKNTNTLRRECRKENIDIYAWHNFIFIFIVVCAEPSGYEIARYETKHILARSWYMLFKFQSMHFKTRGTGRYHALLINRKAVHAYITIYAHTFLQVLPYRVCSRYGALCLIHI